MTGMRVGRNRRAATVNEQERERGEGFPVVLMKRFLFGADLDLIPKSVVPVNDAAFDPLENFLE